MTIQVHGKRRVKIARNIQRMTSKTGLLCLVNNTIITIDTAIITSKGEGGGVHDDVCGNSRGGVGKVSTIIFLS